MPGWVSIPAPTIETLATSVLQTILQLSRKLSRISTATGPLSLLTVNTISFVPSLPNDWRMMSTLIFLVESFEKILKAIPGVSCKPRIDTSATSLSFVTPLMSIFSIFVTSLTIVPGTGFNDDKTSSSTPYFFAISTERLLRTCAPSVASSSISS